jgi:hypothetical protein
MVMVPSHVLRMAVTLGVMTGISLALAPSILLNPGRKSSERNPVPLLGILGCPMDAAWLHADMSDDLMLIIHNPEIVELLWAKSVH